MIPYKLCLFDILSHREAAAQKKDVAAQKKNVAAQKKNVAAQKKDVAAQKKDVAAQKKGVDRPSLDHRHDPYAPPASKPTKWA